jgi:Flp pilus assembly protein TadD
MVLLRLRQFDLAEEEALALLALTGEDPDAHAEIMDRSRHALAALHWIAGRKEAALEQYRVVRRSRKKEGEQPMFESLLLGAAGDPEEADWLIAMMLQRNPLDGMALSARFEMEQAAGNNDAALQTAELMARSGEGDGFSLLRAAKLLNEAGRSAPAAVLFGIVAENSPPNADLLGFLGTTRLSSGDLDGAREAFLAVMELRPDDPRPPFYLGNIALLRNDEGLARQYYDRSLKNNESFVPPLVNLARWQASRGQMKDAMATLADALRRRPGDREATELLRTIQEKVKS